MQTKGWKWAKVEQLLEVNLMLHSRRSRDTQQASGNENQRLYSENQPPNSKIKLSFFKEKKEKCHAAFCFILLVHVWIKMGRCQKLNQADKLDP